MVDLAKIRKKARKKESDASTSGDVPAAAATGEAPVAPQTANAPGGVERQAPPPVAAPAESSAQVVDKLARFKAGAGKRRQTQVVEVEQQIAERLELLTFVIAGEQYAVEIERIVEIVTPRAITVVPNADSSIVGIISLRGTIVTLLDVRAKLRHPAAPATDDNRVVVIDFRNEIIGFTVDRVLRVVKILATEVEPHPVVHATELEAAVRGVFRASGALTILLDLDKLLDSRST